MPKTLLVLIIITSCLFHILKAQCNNDIYFKDIDVLITNYEFLKKDSIFCEIDTPGDNKIVIRIIDCFGNAHFDKYKISTDSLIESGEYIADRKLYKGRRWVTAIDPPYQVKKIKYKYYKPKKTSFGGIIPRR